MVETTWNDLEVASKEVVMQAARQFAEVLAEAPQFQAFEQALFTFRQDAEAQSAIQEFQKKQASLKALLMLNAVSAEDRQELQTLLDRVNQQPSVIAYNQAQGALVALSQELGDLLSKAIGLDYASVCRTGGCCG
ncbi:MAG TPA: YlbF family regulator [Bellilinea sp.]|jgi:cell fate (sporulation/competence/biofilm development) regulator YlbF (YheA/YmcA/DUF963 family)|nr:hypothetical protein [Anaerolineaceae bacterium]HML39360.1 YlbF family regulator [Bellilinea sp.]